MENSRWIGITRCVVVGVLLGLLTAGCAAVGASPLPAVTFAPVPLASSSAASSASPVPGATSTVTLKEWNVAVPAELTAGQVTFTITNAGTIEHEMLVFKSDLDPSQYPRDSAGGIDEEGTGVDLISDGDNIPVGGSQVRTVDLTAPGKYLFVCNIPGHFANGMFTVVIVH